MVSQLERSAGESRVNKIGVKLGYKSVFIDQADERQTKSCNLKQIPTVKKQSEYMKAGIRQNTLGK